MRMEYHLSAQCCLAIVCGSCYIFYLMHIMNFNFADAQK